MADPPLIGCISIIILRPSQSGSVPCHLIGCVSIPTQFTSHPRDVFFFFAPLLLPQFFFSFLCQGLTICVCVLCLDSAERSESFD